MRTLLLASCAALVACGTQRARERSIAPPIASVSATTTQPAIVELPAAASGTAAAPAQATTLALPPAGVMRLGGTADMSELLVDVPVLRVGVRIPVVVAAHKSYGRTGDTCAAARAVFGPRPFVVCPQGQAAGSGTANWKSPEHLRAQIAAGLRALDSQFGAFVDSRNQVFFGHSQGAMIAPVALSAEPARADAGAPVLPEVRFAAALFFEGLPPNLPSAKVYLVRTPLRRLLLVSGQGGWARAHAELAQSLSNTALAAKAVHLGEMGHYLTPAVTQRLAQESGWLLADLDNWQTSAILVQ